MSCGAGQAAAQWLVSVYIPWLAAEVDTMMSSGANAEIARALNDLAVILAKASNRKRSSKIFTINVRKRIASEFVTAVKKARLGPSRLLVSRFRSVPEGVLRAFIRMLKATGAERGRPTLSIQARDARIARSLFVEERYLKRLKAAARRDEAFRRQVREEFARGQTLISGFPPTSKI